MERALKLVEEEEARHKRPILVPALLMGALAALQLARVKEVGDAQSPAQVHSSMLLVVVGGLRGWVLEQRFASNRVPDPAPNLGTFTCCSLLHCAALRLTKCVSPGLHMQLPPPGQAASPPPAPLPARGRRWRPSVSPSQRPAVLSRRSPMAACGRA